MAIKGVLIYAMLRLMQVPLSRSGPCITLLLAQGGEFAFVVFQTATGAKVLSPQTASLLIGAVALSMLVSPLLLVAVDSCWRRAWPRQCGAPGRNLGAAGRAGADRRLRPLRPDRGARDAGPGHPQHRAGPRRRHDRGRAQLRLPRALRRRHAPGPAAHRRRGQRPRCWWWRWTTRNSRSRSSTWCASTSRSCRSWRARAT